MCLFLFPYLVKYRKFRGRQVCNGKGLSVLAKIDSGNALFESLGQTSGMFTHSLSLEIVRFWKKREALLKLSLPQLGPRLVSKNLLLLHFFLLAWLSGFASVKIYQWSMHCIANIVIWTLALCGSVVFLLHYEYGYCVVALCECEMFLQILGSSSWLCFLFD